MRDSNVRTADSNSDVSKTKTSRRNFNKGLFAAGLSLPVAGLGSSRSSLGNSSEKTIVTSINRTEAGNPKSAIYEETKQVPLDWYNQLQHTEKVYENAKLEKIPGVIETEVRPGKYGGRNAYIRVGILEQKADETRGNVPEQVDGVKVEVEEVGKPVLDLCYNLDQGQSIPASSQVKNVNGSYGSLCVPLTKNGTNYFASCEHIWHGVSNDGMWHPNTSSGNKIGNIVYRNCNLDFVVGESVNSHIPTSQIAGTNYYVIGQYTRMGISDLAAQGAYASIRGVKTCSSSGEILTANGYIALVDGGCDNRWHQVKGKWTSAGGDSGAAVYRVTGSQSAKILSMNAGHDQYANDNAYGFGAYHITDQTGYLFV